MIKMAAFICFMFAGAIGGAAASDKLRRARDCCRKIHDILARISVMVRYRALNVYEIVHELRKSDEYAEIAFLRTLPESYEPGNDFHELWSSSVSGDSSIRDEERNILLTFGNSFGTSDIEGQIMSIEAAIESVKAVEKIRSEEYLSKGKMYRCVGLLFGIMAGIMII